MIQDEEAKLALLRESLSNNKSNAPIIINFNSFNAPVGQHNEHVDTVNFTMDKDGSFQIQHTRKVGGMPELPPELSTDKAMVLWQKAQDAGFIDEYYQPTISRTQAALLADAMAHRLGIKEKWKVFEEFWHRNYMRSDYNLALSQQQSYDFQDELKQLFG
ncbi:MAG: hypothetical protein IJT97_10925 [Bacteroidaceae bacterium]|nr:hypothetical protein [Bacteroidaceae bacterium]